MFQRGAMDISKAFFHRFLVLLLGAALISQLALLPARANGLSIHSPAEVASADSIHGSLLERGSRLSRVSRIERHFSDAGSHKLFARALDQNMVQQGARFICALNSRNYPPASTWTDTSAILNHNEGWDSTTVMANDEVINTLQPWFSANGLSATLSDYTTIQTRNDGNKPGASGLSTNAPMKNIFNLNDGTIIVEDVLNPKAAPAIAWNVFLKLVAAMDMTEEDAADFAPPRDASGYAIPSLTQWSDIAYLQLEYVSGGDGGQVQGVKRIIQFHITNVATQTQIREALGTVGKGLSNVNISSNGGNAAVEFLATTEACQALFKTPNGNGGYFLFAQHPEQMGSKTLEKITVFTSDRSETDRDSTNGEDTSVWYYMVAHFVDAPAQDL